MVWCILELVQFYSNYTKPLMFVWYIRSVTPSACRYYVFSMPWLCVADVDVIKQTHVKEFDSFIDKPVSKLIQLLSL